MAEERYEEPSDFGNGVDDEGPRHTSNPGIEKPAASRAESEPSTIWEGLIAGHFSLVEQFERDGRTYLVARRNDPHGPALTQRERTVVAWAARGLSNDEIAEEIGQSPVAIAIQLASAAQKLGVSTRAALVSAAAAFVDVDPGMD